MGLKLVFILFSYLFLTQIVEGNSDEFDCVDIYKQPAFQHPLLKNHKIQENFIFHENHNTNNKYKENDLSCPKGTVPIFKQKNGTGNFHQNTVEYSGQHFATIETILDGSIYRGAEAMISVHNVTVQNNQYSKSQIWLENGPRSELNSIQFGWAVHPRLYGDTLTRFTIYWTADGYKKTGCYNTNCPGFVVTCRDPTIGSYISRSTIYGDKTTVIIQPQVFQDGFTGNWALKNFDEVIGYWPKELFPHLKQGASLVRYGGNTFTSPNGISPPMGNGHFPVVDFHRSSYFLHVKVRNSNYQLVDIKDKMARRYADSYQCYRVSYWGYFKSNGVSFSFGGPGGSCGI
ncbi:uncharacterized protein LOC111831030 isoform X2 [Capsella rubella]|uniref:uncharacterized protein LOC111831030 isoform X2 n=1 Tax=Capsella rubella TaxID=81985 RepID=UPI000CD55D24|nr:uncharacterized protein LOC111831030 isoform X2 [Capsella rubella]